MNDNVEIHVEIPTPVLSPEAAYTLSNWLHELAHEVEFHYGAEIRSYMQWLENQRERKSSGVNNVEFFDDEIDF